MHDIQNREDISLLVNEFYKKVIPDQLIGHFFTRVVHFTWEDHIPVMISFWDTVLFAQLSYKGNPMVKHVALDQLYPLDPLHFDRWLYLWQETVRHHFAGPKADEAIERAHSIAKIMKAKIAAQHPPNT
ncbi:group III truncated hemoglobin [Paraflavitalea pollutisoli]|uniref:group III truncated hemoglobin n=1 Tax=Paraflavitalea pollutisoli TaxID=3034143 RepID=UPI0023EB5849|nr:group III truncated hemoglobin [Paraflavitalea sp. H1-2-19X]